MEWVFACAALIPAVFCPRFLFNGFALPQTLAVSLLSAASMAVGVWRGDFNLSAPTCLILLFLIYTFLTAIRSNPIHNAKKELGLQIPFLLLFLVLAGKAMEDSVRYFVMVSSIVSLLICWYGVSQTRDWDPFFPSAVKKGGPRDNAIGTIGNPNFLASYLSGCFWLTVYAGASYGREYFLISAVILYVLYKTGARAGQLAILGSFIFVVLFSAYKGWFLYGDFVFHLGLAFVFLATIFTFLLFKINWQTFWHSEIDPAGGRVWFSSFRYRLCFWWVAWYLFLRKWLFGWGLWSYRREVYRGQAELNDRYPWFMDRKRYITPQPREVHNDWLEHLFEYGVVGAGIFFVFVGLILFNGFEMVERSPLDLFLLANFVSLIINALFFFALRIPASAVQFWMTAVIILSLSGLVEQYHFTFPWWVIGFLTVLMGMFVWECVVKRVISSRYLMLSMYASDGMRKYELLHKAMVFAPYDTMLRTHATMMTGDSAPVLSINHANVMLEHFDGQITLWAVLYNYALAWLKGYNNFFDVMTFYLKQSHYVLQYFNPANELLSGKNSVSLKSQYIGGAVMREINETTLWKIRAHISGAEKLNADMVILNQEIEKIKLKIQNLQSQIQLAHANIQNMVMYEKKRLNIPDQWVFDTDEGKFKDPATLSSEERKKCGLEG